MASKRQHPYIISQGRGRAGMREQDWEGMAAGRGLRERQERLQEGQDICAAGRNRDRQKAGGKSGVGAQGHEQATLPANVSQSSVWQIMLSSSPHQIRSDLVFTPIRGGWAGEMGACDKHSNPIKTYPAPHQHMCAPNGLGARPPRLSWSCLNQYMPGSAGQVSTPVMEQEETNHRVGAGIHHTQNKTGSLFQCRHGFQKGS